MKQKTLSAGFYLMRLCTVFVLLLLFLVFAYSSVQMCLYVHNFPTFCAALFCVVFTLSVLGTLIFSVRSVSVRLHATEAGVSLSAFGRTVHEILWDDLMEVGIGMVHSPTGPVNRLYFSPVCLTERERNDLDQLRDTVIFFGWYAPETLDYLRELSPIPIPDEAATLRKARETCFCRRTGVKP